MNKLYNIREDFGIEQKNKSTANWRKNGKKKKMKKNEEGGRKGPPCRGSSVKFLIFQLDFRAKTNMIIDGKLRGGD